MLTQLRSTLQKINAAGIIPSLQKLDIKNITEVTGTYSEPMADKQIQEKSAVFPAKIDIIKSCQYLEILSQMEKLIPNLADMSKPL